MGLGCLVAFAIVAPHVASADEPRVDAEARRAIDGSLRWLASQQRADGHWGEQHKAAITGYVAVAFMAAGQLPDEGEHGAAVSRAVAYLMRCVRADGYVVADDEAGDGQGMYGHGIATVALAEACGQAGGNGGDIGRAAELRRRLGRAVRLIVQTQNKQGGWRYQPRVNDADVSVTVLQLVALRAARNDGVDVPGATIDRAVAYVKSCRDKGGSGGFGYQPGGPPGFARTAAAVYALQVCGRYDDPDVAAGSSFLAKSSGRPAQWFTYGNFYAAPAQYMVGGAAWAKWYADVRATLLGRVRREGPLCHWPAVEGDGSGANPVYVTAVNTMILALPDGALPLYQR